MSACTFARHGHAHDPHRWDDVDRVNLRWECPGVTTPKEDR